MASVTFGDELIRDYLVYRGFLTALKSFDSEVKADKDRGFRPDRIVEHLSSCITNLDLNALREAWSHLEQRVFSRLEHSFLSTSRKLENALLQMYLVTCISASRHDKLTDFFEKMTPELQSQSEWREWFALPFLKNPDENPTFATYFTRQWQDKMIVSLHNFISVVFQSIATPSILSYEEELLRLNTLQEENDALKSKLSSLQDGECLRNLTESGTFDTPPPPAELIDDFHVIAQETPTENAARSIKTLIKNFGSGLPSSPVLGRQLHEGRRQDDYSPSGGGKQARIKTRSPSVPPQLSSQMSRTESSHISKQDMVHRTMSIAKGDLGVSSTERKSISSVKERPLQQSSYSPVTVLSDSKSGFIVLSQDYYLEHHSFVTHCKFNCSGTLVASSDMDGVIKIWNPTPAIQTISTIMSKSSVLALDWASKREKLLLHGFTSAKVRLYDIKDRKTIGEIVPSGAASDKHRILCITCNPTEVNFAISSDIDSQGNMFLYDTRTLQLEHHLVLEKRNLNCYCCSFNHNGQLLLVGTSDGSCCIFDLRTYENIASWTACSSPILSIQFSSDENTCYTLSQEGKFCQWSINKIGHQLADIPIHNEITSAFQGKDQSTGKLFAFNSDANYVLTCGPAGGVVYRFSDDGFARALNIGRNQIVTAVDWCTALECSTCLCGSADGKIAVTTLMTQ